MANSRLERIGTIFSRTTGLIRSAAIKPENKPIWYDVYAIFPPHQEPRYDRPASTIPIRNIFYSEDNIRAKYHKVTKNLAAYNLMDTKYQTQTQEFISTYNKINEQGALDEESIFAAAQDVAKEKFESRDHVRNTQSLLSNFTEAQKTQTPVKSVDLKNIFD